MKDNIRATSTQNNKRIVKNTFMLYIRMILIMLVTLYTSRVILNTLGIEDFGIYNVVGGIVTLFAFFNSAMTNATQRFLSFEIGNDNASQLNKVFNVAQIIHIVIALLIFILAETVGLWFVESYLVLPPEKLSSALWVYHFSVLSFLITVIQVPYNSMIIANEKMKVYAFVSILEVLLKLIIVFILVEISFDKLKLYSLLYFFVVLIIAFIYRFYVRYNFKSTRFELVRDKKLYHELLSFSGWSLFGNVAAITKTQGVNVLLNIFFGPTVNAAQGIATQVQGAISSFSSNFQMAMNPQIIKSYATRDIDYMSKLIINGSKYSFYLLFVITFPIILEVDQILKIWLINVPELAAIFTKLICFLVLIDCLSGPLMTAVQATGKIKLYQIVVGTLQLLILPISFIFFEYGAKESISLYVSIVISLIALIFRLFFLKGLLDFSIKTFFNEVILKILIVVILSITIPIIAKSALDAGYIRLIIVSIISLIWTSLVIYGVGLNTEERNYLLNILRKFRIK